MYDQLMFNNNFDNIIKEREKYTGLNYNTLLPEYKLFIKDIIDNNIGNKVVEEDSNYEYHYYGNALILDIDNDNIYFYIIKIYSYMIINIKYVMNIY